MYLNCANSDTAKAQLWVLWVISRSVLIRKEIRLYIGLWWDFEFFGSLIFMSVFFLQVLFQGCLLTEHNLPAFLDQLQKELEEFENKLVESKRNHLR